MAWELDSKRSIYLQLVEIILKKIVTGIYPLGSKLDSVRDLAVEAGVNPNTMQRALAELETTGIITTQRTSGKFVTDNPEVIERIRSDFAQQTTKKYLNEMKELGLDGNQVIELIKEGQI